MLFIGYENADWFIPSPALRSEDIDLKLSPDQIRETLNYFSKCNFQFIYRCLCGVFSVDGINVENIIFKSK